MALSNTNLKRDLPDESIRRTPKVAAMFKGLHPYMGAAVEEGAVLRFYSVNGGRDMNRKIVGRFHCCTMDCTTQAHQHSA